MLLLLFLNVIMCILMFFVLLTSKNVSKQISYPFGKIENIELNEKAIRTDEKDEPRENDSNKCHIRVRLTFEKLFGLHSSSAYI